MKKLIIIAAIGRNNELGYKGNLIWKFKSDMKFFKEKTINHTIVMGDTTFFSLPKLLEDRKHIVLSLNRNDFPSDVIVLRSIDEFKKLSSTIDDDIYIIGGASIYKQFINYADELILTEINDVALADVYFPSFNKDDYDIKVLGENIENNIYFKHVLYKKRLKK